MKDEKDAYFEKRMQRWNIREEMLNSMGEKELRAFLRGYMMGERTVLKHLSAAMESQCGGCGCGDSSCKGESCNCGDKDCKDCKE